MDQPAPKTIDANEAFRVYHVTRAWLRQKRASGAIRCAALKGNDMYGKEYTRNLYNVEDIEREIKNAMTSASDSSQSDPAPDSSPATGDSDKW